MGKILNALQFAEGEVADLMRGTLAPSSPPAREPEPAPPAAWSLAKDADPVEPGRIATRTHILPWPVPERAPLILGGNERAAEQYRAVRTRILHASQRPASLVVSSPGPGDGKTLTALNLASTFARTGDQEILLVDADLRCPATHSRLGMTRSPGLSEVLNGECSLDEGLVRLEQFPNLYVLPSGKTVDNASDLLDSPSWRSLVNRLPARFRTVIFDSPPVDVFTDYDLIAASCDGVILVLSPDCTDRYLAFEALRKTGKKLLGVVINRAEDWFLWKHYSASYYYSPYRQPDQPADKKKKK